jgi:hypothetical protein
MTLTVLDCSAQTYDFKRARDLILGTQGTFVSITFKKNGSAQRYTGSFACAWIVNKPLYSASASLFVTD